MLLMVLIAVLIPEVIIVVVKYVINGTNSNSNNISS